MRLIRYRLWILWSGDENQKLQNDWMAPFRWGGGSLSLMKETKYLGILFPSDSQKKNETDRMMCLGTTVMGSEEVRRKGRVKS